MILYILLQCASIDATRVSIANSCANENEEKDQGYNLGYFSI
jgi:hypothetical protein